MLKHAVVQMVNHALNWVNIFVVHLRAGHISVTNVGLKRTLALTVNNH